MWSLFVWGSALIWSNCGWPTRTNDLHSIAVCHRFRNMAPGAVLSHNFKTHAAMRATSESACNWNQRPHMPIQPTPCCQPLNQAEPLWAENHSMAASLARLSPKEFFGKETPRSLFDQQHSGNATKWVQKESQNRVHAHIYIYTPLRQKASDRFWR